MLKRLRNNLKNKKGFTMVELIVVIVIILVLAAALVPQLLKYVDKANEANCRSEAATLLAQLQADYTAMKAQDETGVDKITEIQGIEIKEAPSIITADTVTANNKAAYHATYDEATKTEEITSFGYFDGKYKAVWTSAGGWDIEKAVTTQNSQGGGLTPPEEEQGETDPQPQG